MTDSGSLRTSLNLGERHQLDFWLRHVDGLPTLPIPSYTTLDVRYAWRPARRVEFALVGQNLLDRCNGIAQAGIPQTSSKCSMGRSNLNLKITSGAANTPPAVTISGSDLTSAASPATTPTGTRASAQSRKSRRSQGGSQSRGGEPIVTKF